MFGKSLSDYVGFQKAALGLIAAVFAVRLLMSLAGVPDSAGKYLSVTSILLLASLYYGWAVGQSGFGSFKQLYALNLLQGLFSQTLIALAIALAIVIGRDNIYTIPEFYPPSAGDSPLPPDGKNWVHAGAHVVLAGAIFLPIFGWLVSSLVFAVTRKKA